MACTQRTRRISPSATAKPIALSEIMAITAAFLMLNPSSRNRLSLCVIRRSQFSVTTQQQISFKRARLIQRPQNRAVQHIVKHTGVRAGCQSNAASRRVQKGPHIAHISDFITENCLRRHCAQKHLDGRRLVDAAHHVKPCLSRIFRE